MSFKSITSPSPRRSSQMGIMQSGSSVGTTLIKASLHGERGTPDRIQGASFVDGVTTPEIGKSPAIANEM